MCCVLLLSRAYGRYVILIICKHFDSMNSEALHNVAQLKQSLKKRKYKAVLSRVQRLLDQLSNDCFSQEYIFLLYMAQSSAINKLFERNLLKKYKYEPPLIEELVHLLTHNLQRCQVVLVELLQINPEIKTKPQKEHPAPYFSLTPHEEEQNNIKLQKIESNHHHKHNPHTHKYLQRYIRLLNASLINIVQMTTIYKRNTDWVTIHSWLDLIQELKFTSAPYLLSQSKIMLFYCKYLSAGNEEQLVQSQSLLERAVQTLIDSMRLCNRASLKGGKPNCINGGKPNSDNGGKEEQGVRKEQQILKYQKMRKQAFKLVLIDLVITIRNNMKLQKEQLATFGAKMVHNIIQSISSQGFVMFKRYLNHQINVHEQYLKYRAEKLDLLTIAALYFPQFIPKVHNANLHIAQKRNKWSNEHKKEQSKREARDSNKGKLIIEELSTAKSIANDKLRINNNNSTSIIYRNSKETSECSKIYRETLFSNLIVPPLQQILTNYSQIKKNISLQTCRKPNLRPTNPDQPKTLRKQRITLKHHDHSNSHHQNQHQELDLDQRYIKIRREDSLLQKQLKSAQQQLTRRVKHNPLLPPDSPLEPHPFLLFSHQLQNAKPYLNPRNSEEHEEQQDSEVKIRSRNSHILNNNNNKPSKVRLFVQILFVNKNWLGIRKIAEKFELLKKKEEEKQKMINNRPTSIINQNPKEETRRPDSFNHLQIITEAILNKHSANGHLSESTEARKQADNRKQIEANYILGQDSIQAIRTKLEKKITKKETTADRSHRNQEAFKQKLKELGTRNFFFKRVESAIKQDDRRSESKDENRSDTFRGLDGSSLGSIESALDLRKKCSIGKVALRRSNFIQDEFV